MQHTSARVLPLVFFLLALAVRLPTLGLPLEGDSAVLASVANRLGTEQGTDLAGQAPLLPALTAVLVASGVPATPALRWTDALLAALLAPLAFWLARRLGARSVTALWAGVVMALHPLALVEAGGLQPGPSSLVAALLLLAVGGLAGAGAAARRAGALAALACAFTTPEGLLYGPLLLAYALYREDGRRARVALALVTAVAFALLPLPRIELSGALDAGAALWLLAAGLGVLWIGVPRAAASLWGHGAAVRCWLVAAAAHLLLLPLAFSPAAGLPLLGLIVILGTRGLLEPERARGLLLVRGSAVLGLVACLWLGLSPAVGGPGERLGLLRDAMDEAAAVAGEDGWIVLAVSSGLPDEQSSLADLQPRHWTWAEGEAPEGARGGGVRALRPFPAVSFETGQRIAVVAEAGTTGAVHTFGGEAIFQQEVVRQLGPFVVLRAQRPRAGPEPAER